MLIVAKFGGSSLAEGRSFLAVRDILRADPSRKAVVVSAPGRRFPGDKKLTDLLLACFEARQSGEAWEPLWARIAGRLLEIRDTCGVLPELEQELDTVETQIAAGEISREELASRGEYFSARLLAAVMGWDFLDSTAWLRFTADGQVDTVRTYGLLYRQARRPFVTPGFYGALPDGRVHTFPRGGSDISGALAAAALEAGLYENWTDVPGILMADPRIYPAARPVPRMTYEALTELSLVGTQVLHEGAVRPVREQGIPLRICSTLSPEQPGTWVTPQLPEDAESGSVLSVTGRRDRVLAAGHDLAELSERDLLTDALGRQTVSLPASVLEDGALPGVTALRDGAALVAVIFSEHPDRGPCAADLLWALRQEQVPVWSILRPFGSHTLLLTVPDGEYEHAVRVLCRAAE